MRWGMPRATMETGHSRVRRLPVWGQPRRFGNANSTIDPVAQRAGPAGLAEPARQAPLAPIAASQEEL